ncbi:MAG TPA: hypothetical protein ENJ80_10715 [Gammaproteobacteria bacterium]|nr:hypothetical protein [Gammaproteobacteria bacterium]
MLKLLSTIWLILALVTVPVQALNAAPEQAGTGPCQMHIDNPDMSGADCPACADRACTADTCTDSGNCTTLHIQPATFSTLHLADAIGTDIPGPSPVYATGSGTAPPPLRPPV